MALTKDQIKFIRDNAYTMTGKAISKHLSISMATVARYRKQMKRTITPQEAHALSRHGTTCEVELAHIRHEKKLRKREWQRAYRDKTKKTDQRRAGRLTQDDKDFIIANAYKMNSSQIADALNIGKDRVKLFRAKNGLMLTMSQSMNLAHHGKLEVTKEEKRARRLVYERNYALKQKQNGRD